jgi:hypothetical protein
MLVSLGSYVGVSPRNLLLIEYNLRFYDNFRLVSLATIAPALFMLSVFDARENDINSVVKTFYFSFTAGYVLTFATEIVATTCIRLFIFRWLEKEAFSSAPRVPAPVLPWVLREINYRPKRISLVAADFLTTCIASPIIEEYMKLKLLEWTVDLSRYVIVLCLFFQNVQSVLTFLNCD